MNNFIMRAASAVLFVATLALPVAAHENHGMHDADAAVMLGDLEITAAFARATLPGAPVGGGFVTITNNGTEDDTLVSATSDFSDNVQLHNMSVVEGVMKMHEMKEGIPVPAGETVTLAPGGLHIMFMQIKEPLVEGTMAKVTLTFEKAGTTEVMLNVRGIGAKADEAMDHDHSMTHKAN